MYPKIPEKISNAKELLTLMPQELIKEFRAFVFEKTAKGAKIGAVDPSNKALRKYAKDRFGKSVEWFQATDENVKLIISNSDRDLKSEVLKLSATALETNNNIVTIVGDIIEYAICDKASDIHIEPLRNETVVRFRVDGVLHTVLNLPRNIHQSLVARFKIISNLKIDEYKRPQDGRIEPEDFPKVSLRTSIIPTLFGEKIALRLLDESNKNISIDELGFSEENKTIILKNIEKPFGMIIASGPTGSGKTTTLYALLQLLKKDGINISTLEDPIEYTLSGVNQVQINPQFDLTFASGLRSLLRQDPNVIMVGEIRDSETAGMAANAAMTGHLVLTTLHTNDAASAFTRLLEMKVEDFVVSGTVNLIIAQRLVRRICPFCAKKRDMDNIILKKIKERPDVINALEAKKGGLSKTIEKEKLSAGAGCDKCYQTGYSGRIGLYEILTPTKEIQDAVLTHKSSANIETIARGQGFKDMVSDGVDKIFEGKTTFEEVLRTTKNS
jgi:type IV pilus assembly protein PilB